MPPVVGIASGDAEARDALREISAEINGLARMIDEMIDVEKPGARSR